MANVARRPVEYANKDIVSIFDHFTWFVTAHLWTSLAADGGASVAVGDAASGVVVLTSGGTDNNEACIRTTNELFLGAAGKPFSGVAKIQYSEAATDAANVLVGFVSALAANTLVDDGGGVRTSGSVFAVFKKDGETEWRLHTRNGSTYTEALSSTTAGGSGYQEIEIFVDEYSTTECVVTAKVNGDWLKYAVSAGEGIAGQVISHRVAYSSLTEMNFGVYVKCGTSASQVVNVDLAGAAQNVI